MTRLKFRETTLKKYISHRQPRRYSLTMLVKDKMGEDTRLVTGQGQRVFAQNGDDVRLLPEWVQNLHVNDRNRIW